MSRPSTSKGTYILNQYGNLASSMCISCSNYLLEGGGGAGVQAKRLNTERR